MGSKAWESPATEKALVFRMLVQKKKRKKKSFKITIPLLNIQFHCGFLLKRKKELKHSKNILLAI